MLVLGLSLFTDYEGGLVPRLPTSVHLGLDVGLGVLLAVAPFAVGLDHRAWGPYLLIGATLVGAALVTDPEPSRSRLAARAAVRR